MSQNPSALNHVRIVDLTDEKCIYGAKLLADLGADTVRPEVTTGDPLRRRGPFDSQSQESLWFSFFCTNRRFFKVEPAQEADRIGLYQLVCHADIVLISPDHALSSCLDFDEVLQDSPNLIVVECSSFGPRGPWKDFLTTELISSALGGAAAPTGDFDTPPLKLTGDIVYMLSGVYTAIAAMAALNYRRDKQLGQKVAVSAHECIASSLEHVLMWYFYGRYFPNARGASLERRGSLHWTDMYHIMAAKNGSIMVTPTPNIDAQLAWLVEEDSYEDLLDPIYDEPGNRRAWLIRMMEILRNWVATKDVESLFFDAQKRHSPYGWVQKIDEVAKNPQLRARGWWNDYAIGDRSVRGVGSPYRFSSTPVKTLASTRIDRTENVLAEIGWVDS